MLFIADVLNRKSSVPILERLRSQDFGLRHVVLVRSTEVTPLSESVYEDVILAAGSVSDAELQKVEVSVDPDSAVNFQFTSGTTGAPKASMLSHL